MLRVIISLAVVFLLIGNDVSARKRVSAQRQQADFATLINDSREAMQNKRFDQAVNLLKQALALQPDSAQTNYDLAISYINLRRYELAIAPAQAAARLDPQHLFAHLNLGYAYEFTRQFDKAEEAYQKAIEVNPQSAIPFNYLGAMAGRRGIYEKEIEWYRKAVALKADFDTAWTNMGMALNKQGKALEAIEAFQSALRANPDNFKANYFLAGTNWRLLRLEETVLAYKQVLRLNPREPEALRTQSLALFGLQRNDEAVANIRAYLGYYGWRDNSAPFLGVLAHFALRRANQPAEAQQLLDEAVQQADMTIWPAPLFRFLRDELTEKELTTQANNPDKLTEMHTYLGLGALLTKQRETALEHFNWVKQFGNRQFVEYPIAMIELKHLSALPAPPPKR